VRGKGDVKFATRRFDHRPTLAAFGLLLGLLLAGAPNAAADPSEAITPIDNNYIRGMAQEGVTAADPRDMIDEGHWVCTSLINGQTLNDLDAQIKSKNPRFTQVQVNALIGFAVAQYCEGESAKLDG
jgi:hypothetical protein